MERIAKKHSSFFSSAVIIGLGIAAIAMYDIGEVHAQQVIEFEEIVVEGRIQKPEAFYILQHANLTYVPLTPQPSFLKELLESVENEEF